MNHDAATTDETQQIDHDVVEHLGQDLKHSVDLTKRHTEMYGTLIVDTLTESPHSPPTTSSSNRRDGRRRIDVVRAHTYTVLQASKLHNP